MQHLLPPRPRRRAPLLAAAVLLAGGLAGCRSTALAAYEPVPAARLELVALAQRGEVPEARLRLVNTSPRELHYAALRGAGVAYRLQCETPAGWRAGIAGWGASALELAPLAPGAELELVVPLPAARCRVGIELFDARGVALATAWSFPFEARDR